MVRRAREASFMAGARVFPGGGVDPDDAESAAQGRLSWSGDPAEGPWRAAALRELAEEVGVVIAVDRGEGPVPDGDRLHWMSTWVTPRGLPRRFDTRFYLLEVPADTVIRQDRSEVFDPVWVTPAGALQAASSGDWLVEFPTRVHLARLASFPDLGDLFGSVPAIPERIEPILECDPDGSWRVVVPGRPDLTGAP